MSAANRILYRCFPEARGKPGIGFFRPPAEVLQVIQDTAELIGRLHRHRVQHSALYGKHILINGFKDDKLPLPAERHLVPYLIDVEKARWRLSRIAIAVRDLSQFHRRVPWNTAQWDMFLEHYVCAGRMERFKPILAWLIQHKTTHKHARRQAPGTADLK